METLDSFASSYPLEILIADDDATRRTATKKQLIQLGYMPEEAASDSEVLAMAETRRYDVILMEVLIPGIKVILDNARQGADQKPLFIAISGARSKEKEGMSLSTQIDSVINRPMGRPELLLQLKACSVLAGKCAVKSDR
jgi:CheY-like chemotaxis protein